MAASVSVNVRVISPPAIRTPGADARSAASPRRSVPASGSSSQRTPSSARRAAISRAPTGPSEADRSPAIRQPWLRSTMIAIESPIAARVAADRGEALLQPARIDPDLEAP